MKVFLTGATGYVGQAIVRSLTSAGHQISGLVRSEAGAEKLSQQGVTPIRGDISNLDLLREQAAQADGTIHTAFQFGANVESWALEDARQVLAQFADAFTMDQMVSSDKAKRELGWSPRAKSLLEEITTGAYTI
jgi:nucleoside-diphosphate-sugar epimerase